MRSPVHRLVARRAVFSGALGLLGLMMASGRSHAAPEGSRITNMSNPNPTTVRVTMVNHAKSDIAVTPDALWAEIKDSYLGGHKFSPSGYKITPLANDLSTPLGGYRMALADAAGTVTDDRIIRITELDETERRLSLFADYLSPAFNGMTVHASYQAVPTESGARYRLDSYSQLNLPVEAGDTPQSIAHRLAGLEAQAGKYLDAYLKSIKEKLEAGPANRQ